VRKNGKGASQLTWGARSAHAVRAQERGVDQRAAGEVLQVQVLAVLAPERAAETARF